VVSLVNFLKIAVRESVLFFLFIFCLVSFAWSQQSNNESPITIDADKFEYKELDQGKIIVAQGKVEAQQDKQKLFADYLEYNYDQDLLTAKNNVKLIEPQGYIIETQEANLHSKLKLGTMNKFSIIAPNGVTIRGDFAEKKDAGIIEVKNGYYTSCTICEGKKTPWEITAKKATLNENENYMQYKNAVLKLYGVPAFYSPYFFHYTGKAKRKSGFLAPEFGGSSYLGTALKIPYYINISPNQDATVKLFTTTKRGNVFEGEHRYLSNYGQIENSLSITSFGNYRPSKSDLKSSENWRYNFKSKTNLTSNQQSNLGWDINNVSDKTFREDFGYGKEDYLTSSLYYNAFQDNGYYEVKSLAFQNLRPENQYYSNKLNQTPLVLPMFESKHQFYEFNDSSTLNFETNMLNISRYEGPESKRFSAKIIWNKDFVTNSGHEFNLFSSLRGDAYRYEKLPFNNKLTYNQDTSRMIPEAGIDWQYPLTRAFNNTKVVVSPLFSAVITPTSNYNKNIFSEDSNNLSELSDTNLFAKSQFSGIDLVENTPRVSYGVKATAYYKDNININTVFGQLYRHKPQEFIYGANNEHLSDYVGRLQLDFSNAVILTYRYKLDKDSLNNKSNEIESLFNYQKAYLLINLLYYKDNLVINEMRNRRELYLETGFKDYNKFSASINGRKNFSSKQDNPNTSFDPNGFISFGGKIQYDDECIVYSLRVDKDYTKNNDKKANTSFWFKVTLKNLG
jgi:LPS-assembly protein